MAMDQNKLDEMIEKYGKTAVVPIEPKLAAKLKEHKIEVYAAEEGGESIGLVPFVEHMYTDAIEMDEKRKLLKEVMTADMNVGGNYYEVLYRFSHLLELENLVSLREEIGDDQFNKALNELRKYPPRTDSDDPWRDMYDRAEYTYETGVQDQDRNERVQYVLKNSPNPSLIFDNTYMDKAMAGVIRDIGKTNMEHWDNQLQCLRQDVEEAMASLLPEGFRTLQNLGTDQEYLEKNYGKKGFDMLKAVHAKPKNEWVSELANAKYSGPPQEEPPATAEEDELPSNGNFGIPPKASKEEKEEVLSAEPPKTGGKKKKKGKYRFKIVNKKGGTINFFQPGAGGTYTRPPKEEYSEEETPEKQPTNKKLTDAIQSAEMQALLQQIEEAELPDDDPWGKGLAPIDLFNNTAGRG